MNENVIQSQIRLVAFKATKVELTCNDDLDNSKDYQAKFDLQLANELISDSPTHFAKVFTVNISMQNGQSPEIITIKVVFNTVFQCNQNIDEAFLNSDFAKISAPAIGFPFLRAFVSNITIQAGVVPVILPSINFIQFNLEAQLE